MNLRLSSSSQTISGEICITGSKSESNRLLILQALYPKISIQNLSNSDDTVVLQKALSSEEKTIDIHHAGTAMRFLTAYFASREGREIVLTGSPRMQERPIELLVNALRNLGADIEYVKKEGFPPLKICGKKLLRKKVALKANISSQYISALMLIAPSLPDGLEISLEGRVTSVPYINMTLSLLKNAGVSAFFQENMIKIEPKKNSDPVAFTVESDWSSASYFYSLAALSENAKINLSSYKSNSFQGDSRVSKIYKKLGVETTFSGSQIYLEKIQNSKLDFLKLDLSDAPDLAQTIAVSCVGLGIACKLSGLHTLKIKETDRLQALQNELEKLGGKVEITSESIEVIPAEALKENTKISTYNDHRMALAFAPLAVKVPLIIEDSEVVSKSYPAYWEDLEKLGFQIE